MLHAGAQMQSTFLLLSSTIHQPSLILCVALALLPFLVFPFHLFIFLLLLHHVGHKDQVLLQQRHFALPPGFTLQSLACHTDASHGRRRSGTRPGTVEDLRRRRKLQAGTLPNCNLQQNLTRGTQQISFRSVRHSGRQSGCQCTRHSFAQSQIKGRRGASHGPSHCSVSTTQDEHYILLYYINHRLTISSSSSSLPSSITATAVEQGPTTFQSSA